MCVCADMSERVPGDQRQSLDPITLDLQVVANLPVRVFLKNNMALNCWVIFQPSSYDLVPGSDSRSCVVPVMVSAAISTRLIEMMYGTLSLCVCG